MKKISLFIFILLLAHISKLTAQYKYACFENDVNKKLQLTVYFKSDKAVLLKYKGQKRSTRLIYSTTEQTGNETGSPAFFWKETYLAKNGRRVTGTYTFTNGGAYELQLSYIDKKTNKKNAFIIIESLAGENFSPYRNAPCF